MRHMISMSGTLQGYLGEARGYPSKLRVREQPKVELSDLMLGTFYFGCSSKHVGDDSEYVPFEATHQNIDLPQLPVTTSWNDLPDPEYGLVSLDCVDEDVRGRAREFCEFVREADKDGRVHWQVGNYPALMAKLAKEADEPSLMFDTVFYWGRWTDLKKILDELSPSEKGEVI